jgi:hydrogenase maturation protease
MVIIAIGNPLRGDDGVSHLVAERICRRLSGRVTLLKRTAPEITDALVVKDLGAGTVVVVDACREDLRDGFVIIKGPFNQESQGLTHSITLLEFMQLLCSLVKGIQVYLVLVRAEEFGFSEGISKAALANASRAAEGIIKLFHKERKNG